MNEEDDIQLNRNGDKIELTIKRGKQCRWFTIDEEEAKELMIKLQQELSQRRTDSCGIQTTNWK